MAISSTASETAPAAMTSGFVVSDLSVVLLAVLAFAGIAAGRGELATLGAIVLVLALFARIWTRVALHEVSYACDTDLDRVVEGDRLLLTLTLENRKPVPVPWVRIQEEIPHGLEMVDDALAAARSGPGATLLVTTTALGPNQRVRLRFRLRATRRGRYAIGPGRLCSGDPFGFYEAERVVVRSMTMVLAYPRLQDIPDLGVALARPLGDRAAAARSITDPSLPQQVREYVPGDGFRDIDWKLWARHGAPWVRVNEASVDAGVVLLVECETRTRGAFSDSPALLERLVRVSAACARDLLARGHSVGLIANGVPPGEQARVAVAPATGAAALPRILDALASVQPVVVKPLSSLVSVHGARALPFGATVVCIAGAIQPDTLDVLQQRYRRGSRPILINVGEDPVPAVPGIETFHWPKAVLP